MKSDVRVVQADKESVFMESEFGGWFQFMICADEAWPKVGLIMHVDGILGVLA
jgi:hypothetical protein